MNECYNIVVAVKVATAVRAIEGSFSAWGGLGKPNRGRDRGETDSGSDRDSDETSSSFVSSIHSFASRQGNCKINPFL